MSNAEISPDLPIEAANLGCKAGQIQNMACFIKDAVVLRRDPAEGSGIAGRNRGARNADCGKAGR